MSTRLVARTLAAAVSGLAVAVSFAPYDVAVLLPFAVAGLVLSVRGLGPRAAALPGLAFGVALWLVLTVWMRAVGSDAWLGMGIFMALFDAVLGPALALLQRLRAWPLWTACAWVAIEAWQTSWPWSGMPWARLAFAVVDTPLAPALPWIGMTGVSLLVALTGSLLAAALAGAAATLRARRTPLGPSRLGPRTLAPRALAPLAAAVVLLAVASAPALVGALAWHGRSVGHATLAVVQGDVPGPRGNDILYDYRQVTQNHVDATVRLGEQVRAGTVPRPDLVVWPENSTAVDPFADAETGSGIEQASRAVDVPLLVGAIVDDGPAHILNQGIVWDPDTGAGQRYTKWHPVVFGEFIPFRDLLAKLQIGRLRMVGRDMQAGTRTEPLRVGRLAVADAICFDVAYDDGLRAQVTRGAQLLVVQTSNATFMGTHQLDQQFATSRLRAVETGRWVAVASPNGISGVVAPDGTVVQQAAERTTDVLVQRVGLVAGVPPALRLGAWPGRAAVLVALLATAAGWVSYRSARRTRRPRTEPESEPA